MKRSYIVPFSLLIGILIVFAVVTYVVIKIPNDDAQSSAKKDLEASPVHVYTDLKGEPLSFESYEGKVRVVNAWASWTPFSAQELKNLETLAQKYSGNNVVVLAINRKEPKEQVTQYLSTIQEFTGIVFAIDVSDAFFTSIGGYAMPETVFYDARGNLIFHKHGDMTLEEMTTHTEEALSSLK